jgi:hypothetical protein
MMTSNTTVEVPLQVMKEREVDQSVNDAFVEIRNLCAYLVEEVGCGRQFVKGMLEVVAYEYEG